jgi:hypothetical protein
MALHPEVLADLLDREVRQARAFLGRRAGDLHRDGHCLVMILVRDDGSWILRLDGSFRVGQEARDCLSDVRFSGDRDERVGVHVEPAAVGLQVHLQIPPAFVIIRLSECREQDAERELAGVPDDTGGDQRALCRGHHVDLVAQVDVVGEHRHCRDDRPVGPDDWVSSPSYTALSWLWGPSPMPVC